MRVNRQNFSVVLSKVSAYSFVMKSPLALHKNAVLICMAGIIIMFSGCFGLGVDVRQSIEMHREINPALNQIHTASIGSALFRLKKTSDLPNAYGGRDIYGGKIDRGFAELRLSGIKANGVIELLVFDVNRESHETTMDRYGRQASVELSQSLNISGSSNPEAVPISLDTNTEKEYTIADVKVTFVSVGRTNVTYKIEDLRTVK